MFYGAFSASGVVLFWELVLLSALLSPVGDLGYATIDQLA
ncbi:putative membrane protein [Escherichia coli ARS4.2123]|nr:putative membrane protein [Escherichia coli ARS4.2123]